MKRGVRATLLCWHSRQHGREVLERAMAALRSRRVDVGRVVYLIQRQEEGRLEFDGAVVEPVLMRLHDPTNHREIYEAVRGVLSRVFDGRPLHVNVSPGTPAMHAVWLVLHAGGALPAGTTLWSSQRTPDTDTTRLDRVDFELTTYLAEVRRARPAKGARAAYDAEARSPARRAALEGLLRRARVAGIPLLITGERGTGKSRLVETLVSPIKRREKLQVVPCGTLEPTLAESVLFGHKRGAFTGADRDREGLLASADEGVLFLDEVQDLPREVQRKLVRFLQDPARRFRRMGDDKERSTDIEIICATNLTMDDLRARLDADFLDRISLLVARVPSLRECREDLEDDWNRVWRELRGQSDLPETAPMDAKLRRVLQTAELPGNLRDLQRLAASTMAWCADLAPPDALSRALPEWVEESARPAPGQSLTGTRKERVDQFLRQLAVEAHAAHGSWVAAAKALGCDERTLRQDAESNGRASR